MAVEDDREPSWLIVDAMNVIGSRPTGWWRDRPGAIRDFVGTLRRYADRNGCDVTVVIDGRPLEDVPEGQHGALDVRYARRSGPDAADDRIVELIEERDARPRVVTADRDLQERVESRGGRVLSPSQLLDDLDRLDAG